MPFLPQASTVFSVGTPKKTPKKQVHLKFFRALTLSFRALRESRLRSSDSFMMMNVWVKRLRTALLSAASPGSTQSAIFAIVFWKHSSATGLSDH